MEFVYDRQIWRITHLKNQPKKLSPQLHIYTTNKKNNGDWGREAKSTKRMCLQNTFEIILFHISLKYYTDE